jgi:hypothetical protein
MICVSCGNNTEGVAGFGSETTNGIALRGTAVAGSVVIIHQAAVTDCDAKVMKDTVDKNGNWAVSVPAGGYLVEMRQDNQAGVRSVIVAPSDTSVEVGVHVAEMNQVLGRIGSSAIGKRTTSVAKKTAVLYGLGLKTDVLADGRFRFDSVPQGKYVVRIEEGSKLLTHRPPGTFSCKGDQVLVTD